MKKIIVMLLITLLIVPTAFAALSYKPISSEVGEDGTLRVTIEVTVDDVVYTEVVPIRGTYTDAYIDTALQNRANSVKTKKQYKDTATTAKTTFDTELDQTVVVEA